MTKEEALRVLGLPSNASVAEVRPAYVDLIKVWHPDRFGSDERVRLKAEAQLKLINEAFEVLRTGKFTYDARPRNADSNPRSASSQQPQNSSGRRPPKAASQSKQSKRAPSLAYVIGQKLGRKPLRYVVLGAAAWLALIVFSDVVGVRPVEPTPSSLIATSPKLAETATGTSPSSEKPATQQSGRLTDGQTVDPSDWRVVEPGEATPKPTSRGRKPKAVPQPSLTDATKDFTTSVTPTNRLITSVERDSMESACSTAKYMEGPASYRRCLLHQRELLAQAPARPDLSGLSASELDSIESACSTAKYMQGAASYNRCLIRLLRQLSRP